MLAPVILFLLLGCVYTATIGDGRTSLIDGRPIDYRSGNGNCIIDGRTYPSETSVPRDHPCHYCICYGGKIDCFWKQCAHIPDGCQVMAFQDTCNPSLYICDIPEKARAAPVYRPVQAVEKPAETPLASSPNVRTTRGPAVGSAPTTSPISPSPLQLLNPRPDVVPPSRHLTPPARQLIEPPSRHLTPPLFPYSAGIPQKKSISIPAQQQQSQLQRRPVDDASRQPSQFGLRMKHKMRFRRSVADITSILDSMLPHSIQEEFPLNFDHDFVVRLVERQIRSRRSINDSPGDNHHHHHDHHHQEDRGCTILGIHYQLGEVIGVASDVCRECRCAAQSLFCSPKCCFKPAPLQQVTGDLIRSLTQTAASGSASEAPEHPLYYVQSEFV